MKKNNKINKIVTFLIIGLILIISLVIFVLNYTKDTEYKDNLFCGSSITNEDIEDPIYKIPKAGYSKAETAV